MGDGWLVDPHSDPSYLPDIVIPIVGRYTNISESGEIDFLYMIVVPLKLILI